MNTEPALILHRSDVARLLDMRECIAALEAALMQQHAGRAIPPAVLGVHVDGGGFHLKTAGLLDGTTGSRFVAKINANFPGNPGRFGLPTIQGAVVLFDAVDGRVLAIMDSIELTKVRTAAATAVAAKHLARATANTAMLCGCGVQGLAQLRALHIVRPLRAALVYDIDADRARRFARELSAELSLPIEAVESLGDAARACSLWVTCTPAKQWFVGRVHVEAGSFIAAVGADSEGKQEIEPELLAASAVVADSLAQCAAIGDLHHALEAGVMRLGDVRAELPAVVSGHAPGRLNDAEILIYDSTGTAMQDVAAAQLVYEQARRLGAGQAVHLNALPTR